MRTHIDRVTGLRALPESEGAILELWGFEAILFLSYYSSMNTIDKTFVYDFLHLVNTALSLLIYCKSRKQKFCHVYEILHKYVCM